MEVWKNVSINGWIRYSGGVDLKMGSNSFQSNFGATADSYQNFHRQAYDQMTLKYSASVFPDCHKIH